MELFVEEGDYNIMIMEMLGPSIETLFEYFGRKFSPKTQLMLADQMVRLWNHCRSRVWKRCTQRTSSIATSSPKTSSSALGRRQT